ADALAVERRRAAVAVAGAGEADQVAGGRRAGGEPAGAGGDVEPAGADADGVREDGGVPGRGRVAGDVESHRLVAVAAGGGQGDRGVADRAHREATAAAGAGGDALDEA